MRLIEVQDFRICPHFHKGTKNETISAGRIFHGRIQFSIREGSCPSLTKLNIAFRIQYTCVPEEIHLFLARFYGIASFQKDRSAAETGKDQTGKETGRSGTDDHRPSGRRLF